MKQIQLIVKLKNILPTISGIEVALLFGSFANNEATPNSDIDIQILVNKTFDPKRFKSSILNEFKDDILHFHEVALRNKIVVYFKHLPKTEFAVCRKISDINKNYLGSEIVQVEQTILYASAAWKEKINIYLNKIIHKHNKITVKNKEKMVSELIDKFIYEFENCSAMHRRSDAYKFYFFYNIALHVAIQLRHLALGQIKYNFLPKQFVTNILNTDEQDKFYYLKGTLFLPEANQQKRKLLEFFYSSVKSLIDYKTFNKIHNTLEWFYERDFFWNFRDISTYNPKIKSGIVYRTATLTLFQKEKIFEKLLENKKIKTVIDLRADQELEMEHYSEDLKRKFKYIRAPFDPWNQPEWFKEKYYFGTNEEIAYRFFAIGCKEQIKTALEAIIHENEATVIHCFAGKDRTGIFISLLHLLVEAPLDIIYTDYFASEVDVKKYRLDIVLNIINEHGGIIPYLISCGLKQNQIEQLKNKLLYGN